MLRTSRGHTLALAAAIACGISLFTAPAEADPAAPGPERGGGARASADRGDDYMLQVKKDYTLKEGRVSIRNSFGDVRVRTHPGNVLELRAVIRASSARLGREIRVIPTQGADGISFRTEYPRTIRNGSFSVDYVVTIPATAPLVVENRFGNTDVEGLRAAGDINSAQGAVRVHDTAARQQIDNSFGPVEVTGSSGEIVVRNANGAVRVQDVHGTIDVTNRFGGVVVRNVDRNATVRSENGAVDVSDVGGLATVSTSFGKANVARVKGALDLSDSNGSVAVSEIAGHTKIRNSFGTVRASAVGALDVTAQNSTIDASAVTGNLSVATSFGTVKAERIRGAAKVINANGNISLSDTTGDVAVKTTFGSVFVNGAGGAIDVDNQNGAISVGGLTPGRCHDISLNTNFSSIRVALREGFGYTVDARTSFGSISSAIPVATTTASSDVLRGTIGNGGCRLALTAANGNITIDKE